MKRHIDNKTALKIIVDTAKRYDEKLNDKHFLILYQVGGETKSVSVAFRDMNCDIDCLLRYGFTTLKQKNRKGSWRIT